MMFVDGTGASISSTELDTALASRSVGLRVTHDREFDIQPFGIDTMGLEPAARTLELTRGGRVLAREQTDTGRQIAALRAPV